jgi:hypothetical protein
MKNKKYRAPFLGKRTFELGKYYELTWDGRYGFIGRFIQVTRCGYNFLNEETNRCILASHLYIPKKFKAESSEDKKHFLLYGAIKTIREVDIELLYK